MDKYRYSYCPKCLHYSVYEPENNCIFCKTPEVPIPDAFSFDAKEAFLNGPERKKDIRFSQEAYEKRINYVPVKMYSAPNGGARCISCGSSNVKKISVASKVGSVALWGIFAAGRTSKRYHCNKCGTEW